MNVVRYRKRRMNRHKKRKYLKKMKYRIAKRLQVKEKRFEKLKDLYKSIFEQRTALFDAEKYVDRELEKAKFYSYRVSNTYDDLREFVKRTMNPFPSEYFRVFEDIEPGTRKKKVSLFSEEIIGFDYRKRKPSPL